MGTIHNPRQRKMISKWVFCKNDWCGEKFERTSANNKICPKCKEKSKRLGNIKRKKTFARKRSYKILDAKLLKLKKETKGLSGSSRKCKRLWKIVDWRGNVLAKGIRSERTADTIMRRMKLNPKDDLRIVSY